MSDNVTVLDPSDPATRQRAYRLRAKVKRGDVLEPPDVGWLAEYEAAQKGASSSSKVTFTEEHHAAVGTGSAAEIAAAASLAKAEGQRIDYLMQAAMSAMMNACTLYGNMCQSMLARNQQMEDVHMSMLNAVREHYIARTEAEVDAIRNESEDPMSQLASVLVPMLQAKMGGGALPAPTPASNHRKRRGAKSR